MPGVAEIALICALVFFAGIVKGFFGIGIPPILMGTLTFLFDPRLVLTLILVPIIAGNARQALRGADPVQIIQKHIWFLLVASLATVGLAYVSSAYSPAILLVFTGSAMVLFAVPSLLGRIPPLAPHWKWQAKSPLVPQAAFLAV